MWNSSKSAYRTLTVRCIETFEKISSTTLESSVHSLSSPLSMHLGWLWIGETVRYWIENGFWRNNRNRFFRLRCRLNRTIESNQSASEYRLNRTNPLPNTDWIEQIRFRFRLNRTNPRPTSIESNKSASDVGWIKQIGLRCRLNQTNRLPMSFRLNRTIESNESDAIHSAIIRAWGAVLPSPPV